MKNLVYIVIFLIALVSCTSSKTTVADNKENPAKDQVADNQKKDTIRIANDEYEYEVIIYEVGFNTWLASRARPRGYYSESYLENYNRNYVFEYNSRVMQPQRYNPNLYVMQIDYSPNIHYGYEVNYMLFNYFLFFQEKYNQNLYPGSRQRI